MARFRLKDKHYLPVPGTEWEQKEVSQTTQKQIVKKYAVPLYLDPDNPSDQNYPGEIIVATKEDVRYPRDIIFTGLPTVDMEPLDEEAIALLAKLPKTTHPIEGLPGTFTESLLEKFSREADIAARKNPAVSGISLKEADDLKALLAQQAAQIASLMEMIQPQAKDAEPAQPSGRRKVA